MFGVVKRHIGMLKQFVAIPAILWRDRDTNRRRDPQMISSNLKIMTETRHHIMRDLLGLVAIGTRADQDDFITAEPRDMTAPVEGDREPVGHGAEQLIADDMA